LRSAAARIEINVPDGLGIDGDAVPGADGISLRAVHVALARGTARPRASSTVNRSTNKYNQYN